MAAPRKHLAWEVALPWRGGIPEAWVGEQGRKCPQRYEMMPIPTTLRTFAFAVLSAWNNFSQALSLLAPCCSNLRWSAAPSERPSLTARLK